MPADILTFRDYAPKPRPQEIKEAEIVVHPTYAKMIADAFNTAPCETGGEMFWAPEKDPA